MRIGLIGAGWVTEHHLDAYRLLADRAHVVAVADPDPAARAARARTYGIPATYASAPEMLESECLDAVDIAAPRERHVELALLTADHGLPILCQKPLAPTLAEAEDLVARIGGRVRLMVHENWRFRPHYRRIKEWLDEGRIGRLQQAQMELFTSGLVPDAQGRCPAIERQPFFRELGRLLVMEVMIHHLDTLRYLLGPLARRTSRIGKASQAVKGEDNATLYLATLDGASVVLTGNLRADGWPPEQRDRLELLGDLGTIRLAGEALQCFGARPDGATLELGGNYKASYRRAIAHFLDCLETGAPFETSPEDNLETLRIVEAVYAAADRR